MAPRTPRSTRQCEPAYQWELTSARNTAAEFMSFARPESHRAPHRRGPLRSRWPSSTSRRSARGPAIQAAPPSQTAIAEPCGDRYEDSADDQPGGTPRDAVRRWCSPPVCREATEQSDVFLASEERSHGRGVTDSALPGGRSHELLVLAAATCRANGLVSASRAVHTLPLA